MRTPPLRSAWLRTVSSQLGNPRGVLGGLVARRLNKNNRGIATAAVSALGSLADAQVADIGFGGGVGLELMLTAAPDARVYGIDPSASMIERARREFGDYLASGRLSLDLATMDQLPFGDGQLDAWISLNTVYFIDDLGPSLAELARVLAPDGVGVIGAADPEWLGAQPFAQHGFTVRALAELTSQIDSAGMTVERRTTASDSPEHPYNLLICRPR